MHQKKQQSRIEEHTKPLPIRLNSRIWNLSRLERCSLKNIPILISDRFPLLIHIQLADLLRITIEILALDFDIGHAIAGGVLAATA